MQTAQLFIVLGYVLFLVEAFTKCTPEETIKSLTKLIEHAKDKEALNCECNQTNSRTQEKNESHSCLCLSVPQNTCNISCFKDGFQTAIKELQNLENSIPAEKGVLKLGRLCRDLPCATSCNNTFTSNVMGFLHGLNDALKYANNQRMQLS
ncbi:interleukin-9-like [Rhinatrema bivittatum]|uniref:interleukin-9-like n=1 Tax=Rhinatrema bivittatum TaxID=194408 RepID=UPI001126AEA5|nr:interleukin-9-like [Rhinatrema bivittatum]